MVGFNMISLIQSLEEECEELGFKMSYARHRGSYNEDVVALVPKDSNALPVYSRDAEIFIGSLEILQHFLRGVRWARDYDRMLCVSDETRRERKEQDYRNQELVNILREEKNKKESHLP